MRKINQYKTRSVNTDIKTAAVTVLFICENQEERLNMLSRDIWKKIKLNINIKNTVSQMKNTVGEINRSDMAEEKSMTLKTQ